MTGVKSPRAVVVDVDGTLYPAGPMRRRMLWACFGQWRILRVAQRVREELRGTPFENGAAFLEAEQATVATRLGISPSAARAALDEIFDNKLARVLAEVGPFPGTREALLALNAHGVRLGVLSDRRIGRKLEALGLGDIPFHAKHAADDTGVLKPHPTAFLAICRDLDAPPHDVLFLGDSQRLDVAGARAAGLSACWTASVGISACVASAVAREA